MTKGIWIIGCVLGLAAVGCAPKNVVALKRDAPPVQPIPGFYERKEAGYSIWVPETYQVPKDAGMSLGDLQNLSNPAASYGMAPPQESSNKEGTLVLHDKTYRPLPGEPATGFTVNIETKSGGADSEAEFKKISDSRMLEGSGKIELPVGPAYVVKLHNKMVTGDEVWRIKYLICDGEKVYHLEFTTTNGESAISTHAPQIAESFRVN